MFKTSYDLIRCSLLFLVLSFYIIFFNTFYPEICSVLLMCYMSGAMIPCPNFKINVIILRDKCSIAINPLTSRPECMPGSRYTGVGVIFFVI